jgi:hypothetical protein
LAVCLPKISSAHVEAAIRFRRRPVELDALQWSARCGMMIGCAAATGLPGVTNLFALLRLLPVSDRDKDIEILALRHQITVLERQLGGTRPRFSSANRAFLAALLHRLPWHVLGRFQLLVRPDTVLHLCVPRTSSTSCDQAIFVDHAIDASVSSDTVLLKIDRFG